MDSWRVLHVRDDRFVYRQYQLVYVVELRCPVV